jgi:hypothetical protein
MKSMTIISEQELDIAALANRYRDVGKVFAYETELTVQNDDWGWFRMELIDTAMSLAEFEPGEKVRLLALIGQPFFAALPFRNSASVNLAVSRLPPNDNLFINTEYDVIFTVKEIHRRFQTGEDWETVGKEFV